MDFKKEISKRSKEALIETLDKLIGIDEKEFLRDCIKVEQNLILEKMDRVCKKGNSIMQLIKLRERYEKLSEELRNM